MSYSVVDVYDYYCFCSYGVCVTVSVMAKIYKLDENRNPVEVSIGEDFHFNEESRRVQLTGLPNGGTVSTVFLCIDHNYGGTGDPILFESMYFPVDDYNDEDCERYRTWDDAEAGHWRMVEKYGGTRPHTITLEDELFEL